MNDAQTQVHSEEKMEDRSERRQIKKHEKAVESETSGGTADERHKPDEGIEANQQ